MIFKRYTATCDPFRPVDGLCLQADDALTALRFDETGLMCAVGTSSGLVAVFDLRSSKPLSIKDHMYSSPIVDLKFKEADNQLGALRVPCQLRPGASREQKKENASFTAEDA